MRQQPKPHTPRDEDYLKWIRTHDCILKYTGECLGDVVPHHFGKGGMSIKCSDYETVPMCVYHHHKEHTEGTTYEERKKFEEYAEKAYKLFVMLNMEG